jgi:hypothetical protein
MTDQHDRSPQALPTRRTDAADPEVREPRPDYAPPRWRVPTDPPPV